MKPTTESLLAFVNAEADSLRSAMEAWNASTDPDIERYGETKVSVECRAFALRCLRSYINAESEEKVNQP